MPDAHAPRGTASSVETPVEVPPLGGRDPSVGGDRATSAARGSGR